MRRKLTKRELQSAVETKLAELRQGYRPPEELDNPQAREMAQWRLGQINMLDEVRMMLVGIRRSFI